MARERLARRLAARLNYTYATSFSNQLAWDRSKR